MSNVKGIGLTTEDLKRLLACVAIAAKACQEAGDYEEAFNFIMLGIKLTSFEDIEVKGNSTGDNNTAFDELLRSMGGEGN